MITIILTFVLFALIVIFDAVKDVLRDRFEGSIFDKHPNLFPRQWWDAAISWINKWELDENGEIKLDANGKRIPKKFWGINIPAAFTDGWHFIKLLLYIALILVVSINLPLFAWYINFVILSIIYGITWWLFYEKLLL